MRDRIDPSPESMRQRYDVPLPGNYPCLTLQINVTYHPKLGTGKWVAVLREPNDHLELARAFGEIDEWGKTRLDAATAMSLLMAQMDYLGGGRGLLMEG